MPPRGKESAVKQQNPATFFAQNRAFAGFDNPGKSLYTTIREYVENSLDATEENNILPAINVHLEHVPDSQVNDLYGDEKRKETEEARRLREEARLESEALARDVELELSKTASGAPAKGAAAKGAAAAAAESAKKKAPKDSFYRVTVMDNGCGMRHEDVPLMLGRVLSGTKFTLKQARGRFGLGAKMTLLYAKMTSGQPLDIFTARRGSKTISHILLDINMRENQPRIVKQEQLPNDGTVKHFPANWHGSQISVVIRGSWSGVSGSTYQRKILSYMRRLAVITPHAAFIFKYSDPRGGHEKECFTIQYKRRTDTMPPLPKVVRHHPSSVNLMEVTSLINEARQQNEDMTLKTFLTKSFACISKRNVYEFIDSLGKKFDADMPIAEITSDLTRHLVRLLNEGEWSDPSADCLSPVGVYNLYLGIVKEIKPEMAVTREEPPSVYQGHAFIVEAAIALGGKGAKQGITCFRYANRIPLLYNEGADVVTRVAKELRWGDYKINAKEDRIGVFVSIVSTKIPFKDAGKEFVSDEIDAIRVAVENALKFCARQLKVKIDRKRRLKEQQQRKKDLERYVPDATNAIFNVLRSIVASDQTRQQVAAMDATRSVAMPTPRVGLAAVRMATENSAAEVLDRIKTGRLTKQDIQESLKRKIQEYDEEEQMNYLNKRGRIAVDSKPEALYMVPLATDPTTRAAVQAAAFEMHFIRALNGCVE